MNPYKRAALFVIRLAAAGLILVGLLNVGLCLVKLRLDGGGSGGLAMVLRIAWLSIPLVIGAALWIRSHALAGWLAGFYED